jgi:hypothetical protein
VLAAGLCLASLSPSSVARAGDDVPAAAAVPPRLAAVEVEIRCLERRLASLRRARTELSQGRSEPAPADDVARKVLDADRRAMDEVRRYEAARAKALTALEKSTEAKDDAKAAETRSAIDRLDVEFVEAVKKIDATRPPKSAVARSEPRDGDEGSKGAGRKPEKDGED